MILTLGTPEAVELSVDTVSGARLGRLWALGRQWLLEPSATYGRPRTPFAAVGMGGWDEAIPSITPGTRSADHGNVWNREWNLHSYDSYHVSMSVALGTFPATFHRNGEGAKERVHARLSP